MHGITTPQPLGALHGKDVSMYRSAEQVRANRISSMSSSAHLRKMFVEGKERELMKHHTAPVRSLREHILRMSLFPNIHNKAELEKGF